MREGKSLQHLLDVKLPPEAMAWEHAMDISGSVYKRMKQLGLKKQDLANRMSVTPAQITKILTGSQNMTLKTIAKLESALDFDLSHGFSHPKKGIDTDYALLIRNYRDSTGKVRDKRNELTRAAARRAFTVETIR